MNRLRATGGPLTEDQKRRNLANIARLKQQKAARDNPPPLPLQRIAPSKPYPTTSLLPE